ncbi:DUF5615 family PIN-like protein [Leptolyngbya sp. PCC 6406]|uniref:DUF5615 family PIN-like protein n=1 Tax=Leptolyngbya sp. PCC 6406 TaxID=1173264 RepID=UPI0002AC5330|nr:DUF5615 family PIN-like protein [Leptolyngbya sp. PCC 6406]
MLFRLYANENLTFELVETLRQRGHDVLTSLDAGNANQRIPDAQVLKTATADNRAVITLNRDDFLMLRGLRWPCPHSQWKPNGLWP